MDPFEPADNNGNQYAEIYRTTIDPNSSESFRLQIRQYLTPVRDRGFSPVHMSAYLKNSIFPGPRFYEYVASRVVKRLDEIAETGSCDMVFVWEIGDITMLTRDHIEELKMLRPDINSAKLYNLRERICQGVNDLEDSINIIRNVDNIEDALLGETNEMRRAAPIYDALKELYNSIQSNETSNGKKPSISHDLLDKLGLLEQEEEICKIVRKHQKVYHQRWKYAKKCIELVNRRSAKSKTKKFANIVLCEEGVASAAAQLMLAGLSSSIPIENIYSTCELDSRKIWARIKSTCEKIQGRFGKECLLIHVTSGSVFGGIPLFVPWSIRANEAMKYLYNFQRDML